MLNFIGGIILKHNLNELLLKPSLYKETETAFWDDEHISKEMLKAHLNPEFEGASRSFDFIDKSVEWIKEIATSTEFSKLLDVGCGHGLYAERFTNAGFNVTGVDFSKRSIQYAKQSAVEKKLQIEYLYENYLELELNQKFDIAAMIYCDYGALSEKNRKVILQKVYAHLREGGKFLLDVFSMRKSSMFREKKTWEVYPEGGFWSEKPYTILEADYRYGTNVALEQKAVITENEASCYYLWTTFFTKESFIKEATEIGFKVCGVYADVAGNPYSENSNTIALLLEK